MYKCLRCDGVFCCNELKRNEEYRGEYQGKPAFESERCCPRCGYDVEYCGEWGDDEDECVIPLV